MTIADQILAIQAELDAVKTAVAAIPTTPATATVDLSPVITAVAGVQSTVDVIKADLTPTAAPAAAPAA